MIAILQLETILHKTLFWNHLHFERLSVGCLILLQRGIFFSQHDVTIQLRCADTDIIAMHVQGHIYHSATIFSYCQSTGRIQTIPIHLIAHTIEAWSHIGWDGECRYSIENVVTILQECTVAIVPFLVYLSTTEAHYFTSFGRCTILVYIKSKGTVASPIGIDKCIHPYALIIKGRLNFLTCLGREDTFRYKVIVGKLFCTCDTLFVKTYTH